MPVGPEASWVGPGPKGDIAFPSHKTAAKERSLRPDSVELQLAWIFSWLRLFERLLEIPSTEVRTKVSPHATSTQLRTARRLTACFVKIDHSIHASGIRVASTERTVPSTAAWNGHQPEGTVMVPESNNSNTEKQFCTQCFQINPRNSNQIIQSYLGGNIQISQYIPSKNHKLQIHHSHKLYPKLESRARSFSRGGQRCPLACRTRHVKGEILPRATSEQGGGWAGQNFKLAFEPATDAHGDAHVKLKLHSYGHDCKIAHASLRTCLQRCTRKLHKIACHKSKDVFTFSVAHGNAQKLRNNEPSSYGQRLSYLFVSKLKSQTPNISFP